MYFIYFMTNAKFTFILNQSNKNPLKSHSLLAQAPSHLQSEVHLNPPVTHLHLVQLFLHVQL